jgi:uncharacterized protein (UPF0212 family)
MFILLSALLNIPPLQVESCDDAALSCFGGANLKLRPADAHWVALKVGSTCCPRVLWPLIEAFGSYAVAGKTLAACTAAYEAEEPRILSVQDQR